MTRLALNKSSLQKRTRNLKTYEKYLPSLDLKRRQLIAERNRERADLSITEKAISEITTQIRQRLPMLGDTRIDLSNLAQVADLTLDYKSVLGTRLPVLLSTQVVTRKYAVLGRPFWVDIVAESLAKTLTLKIRERIQKTRLQRLENAVQRITQRVNLFEKVLIPRARTDVKRIRVTLSDSERAAVVRAKIAKSKIESK